MIIIRTSADLGRVLASPIGTNLKRVLALRRAQLAGGDLITVARFVVVECGDELASLYPDPTLDLGDSAGSARTISHPFGNGRGGTKVGAS